MAGTIVDHRQQQQESPWTDLGAPLPDSPRGAQVSSPSSDRHLSTADKLAQPTPSGHPKSKSRSKPRPRYRSRAGGVAAWALEEGEILRGNTSNLTVTVSPATGSKHIRQPDSATVFSASSSGSQPRSAADHLMAQFNDDLWTQPLGDLTGAGEGENKGNASAVADGRWGGPSETSTAATTTRPTRRENSISDTTGWDTAPSGPAGPRRREKPAPRANSTSFAAAAPPSADVPPATDILVRPRAISTGTGRLLFLEAKSSTTGTAALEKNAWASALESAASASGLDEYRPKPLTKREAVPGPPSGPAPLIRRGSGETSDKAGNAAGAVTWGAYESAGGDWGGSTDATAAGGGWGAGADTPAASGRGNWSQGAAKRASSDWGAGANKNAAATESAWGADANAAASSGWGETAADFTWGGTANAQVPTSKNPEPTKAGGDAFETVSTDIDQALPKPEATAAPLVPATAAAGDADPRGSSWASGADPWGTSAGAGQGEPVATTLTTTAPSKGDWGSPPASAAPTTHGARNDEDRGLFSSGPSGPPPRGSFPLPSARGGKSPNILRRAEEGPRLDSSASQAGAHLSEERRKTAASRLVSMGFSTQREDAKQVLEKAKAASLTPVRGAPVANAGANDAWGAPVAGGDDWGSGLGVAPAPSQGPRGRNAGDGAREESDTWVSATGSAKTEAPPTPTRDTSSRGTVGTRQGANDNDWGKSNAPAPAATQAKSDPWGANAGGDWNATATPSAASKSKSYTRPVGGGAQAEADAWASATASSAKGKPEPAQRKPADKDEWAKVASVTGNWDASTTSSPQAMMTSPPIRTHSSVSAQRNKSPAKIWMAPGGASGQAAKGVNVTAPAATSSSRDMASAAAADKDKVVDEPDITPEEAYAAYYCQHGYDLSYYDYHRSYGDPHYSPHHHYPRHYGYAPPQPHSPYYSHGSYPPPGPPSVHSYPPSHSPYSPHHSYATLSPPGGYRHPSHPSPPPPPHQLYYPAGSVDAYGPPPCELDPANKTGLHAALHHYPPDPHVRSWYSAGHALPLHGAAASGRGHKEVAPQRSPSSARAQDQYRG